MAHRPPAPFLFVSALLLPLFATNLFAACSSNDPAVTSTVADGAIPKKVPPDAPPPSEIDATMDDVFVEDTGPTPEAEPPDTEPPPDTAPPDDASDALPPDDANDGGPLDAGDAAPHPDAGDAAAPLCKKESAANLVPNGGFDKDVAGWPGVAGEILPKWVAKDATGCATSGAISILNEKDAGINNGTTVCVPVTAGVSYDFGVDVFLPASGPHGQAYLQIDWNTQANCQGAGATLQQLTANGAKVDAWQALSGSAVAPASAKGASVYLQIVQGTGSGFAPLFDDVYLTPHPGGF